MLPGIRERELQDVDLVLIAFLCDRRRLIERLLQPIPELIGDLRQLFAGLLRHHVRRVPVGPVRVALPSAFFVLPVVYEMLEGRRKTVDGRQQEFDA